MANKTKTITLFKSYSQKERNEKISELQTTLPQFEIYKNHSQNLRTYMVSYQVKATGPTEAINEYLNKQESKTNAPIQVIIDLLKTELEPLRTIYHEKTEEWSKREFENITKLANLTQEQLLAQYGKDVTETYRIIPQNIKDWNAGCKETVDQGITTYLEKTWKLAEMHYQNSIVKLANRINNKKLNIKNLKAKTEYSRVDVNISTIISDGEESVRAWTIIAGGEIQRPHYRYLVK